MHKLFFRLSIILVLVPLVFVTACSDDDDSPSASPSGEQTSTVTTTTQPETTAVTSSQTQSATATQLQTSSETSAAPDVVTGSVKVDFTGAPEEFPAIDMAFEVETGSTAWEAIKAALGEENITYQDFGGDLGVFITGFNGVDAEGNHFWEFKPNGETAEVGVSKYEVQDGDVLEFAYSSF